MCIRDRVDTIIVKDLSRFGRNYLDVGNYLEIKYPTLGVRFIAIQENVDTLKETGTEMMPFNHIFNEWYACLLYTSGCRALCNNGGHPRFSEGQRHFLRQKNNTGRYCEAL